MTSKPKGIVKSQRGCCVVGCNNSETKNPELHFYRFPGRKWEVERKQAWIDAVNRRDSDNRPWTPKAHTRICSAHFFGGAKSETSYSESYIPTIFPGRLEPVPKRFRFNEPTEAIINSALDPHFEIVDVKCEMTEVETATMGCQTDPWFDQPVNEANVLFCWTRDKDSSTQTQIYMQKPFRKRRTIVDDPIVNRTDKASGSDGEMNSSLWRFLEISDDATMRQLTGITLEFFSLLLNLIVPNRGGQPAFFKKLRKEDRLFLFLLKMKLGVSFCALGCLFHIHSTTASRTFFQILETLSEKTRDWIAWPSRESVKTSSTSTFGRYPNLRYVLGCIEVRTETPATAEQRLAMYSAKRDASTVKFWIAVAPDGNVCQVSKGYGGNADTSFIIDDSGFFDVLEPGDTVIAEKSFSDIKPELAKRDVTLVIPQSEIDATKRVIVKIHENRAMQRIKMLRVLEHFSVELLPRKESIMHVCCIMANGCFPQRILSRAGTEHA